MKRRSSLTAVTRVIRKSSVSLSEKGPVRPVNADNVLTDDRLGGFFVADGVGVSEWSAEASRFAVATAYLLWKQALKADPDAEPDLVSIISEVWRPFLDHFAGVTVPATTLTIATVRSGRIHLASVGDSPAFLLIDGGAHLLTRDHTIADHGRVISSYSSLKTMGGSSTLFSSIGRYAPQPVSYAPLDCIPGGRLLLCTDGLLEVVSQEELGELSKASGTIGSLRHAISRRAGARCARDNYSCVLVDLGEEELVR